MKEFIAIKAAVIREKGHDFQIEDIKIRQPIHNEVLIKVSAVGVCHTDVIVREQHIPVPLPAVLGHEGSGIIVAKGPEVKGLDIGDHVVLAFDYCTRCHPCESGHQAYCNDFYIRNFGGHGIDSPRIFFDQNNNEIHDHFFGQSSFATYAIATDANAIKVSQNAPLHLLGPLGCGIQTGAGASINSLKVRAGSSFVTLGAGAVGLSSLMGAKVCGATTLIAVDVVESRLALARELGATHTINSKTHDVVNEIKKITESGANYILETTGIPSLVTQGVLALAVKGKMGIVGAPPVGVKAEFDVMDMIVTGKQIIGICEGDSIPKSFIPQLIELYMKGLFPFDKLVKYYPFSEINTAIKDSLEGRVLKPILKIS